MLIIENTVCKIEDNQSVMEYASAAFLEYNTH